MSVPMVTLNQLLLVAIGGAIGASLRFVVSMSLAHVSDALPLGTLLVNVIGAFMAGILIVWFWHKGLIGSSFHLVLMVGLLGGFTTFSAFSVETLALVERGLWTTAIYSVAANVLGSLIAVWGGAAIMRFWLNI